MKLFYYCVWILIWPFTAAGALEITSPSAILSFGIGPQQSPSELAKNWAPIIRHISRESGVPLEFATAKDIPAYQQKMESGLYDIAYINPYHYVTFNQTTGYTAFAKQENGTFVSIVVVRKDSPAMKLEDLDGKQLASPSPTALVNMLALSHLKNKSINITPSYVVSLDSVYRSVAKNLFAAGIAEARTFNTIDPEVRNQLRILWSSDPLPPFAFSAHPRVPKATLQKIQTAMLNMTKTPQGISLLKAVNFNGFIASHDSDYDAVRALKLSAPAFPP